MKKEHCPESYTEESDLYENRDAFNPELIQQYNQLHLILEDIRKSGRIVRDPLLIKQLEEYGLVSKEEADEMRLLRQEEKDAKKTPSKTTHE